MASAVRIGTPRRFVMYSVSFDGSQRGRAMDIGSLRGFLFAVLVAQLARPAAAGTYEVQITREQHQRFVNAARVWQEPRPDDILSAEANGYRIIDRLDCQFVPHKFAGGATPKFLCALLDQNGQATNDVVKIKYGLNNREIPGEVAGGNLLRHLGFGGDHMRVARLLVCSGSGCPKGTLEWVAVERRMEGHELLVGRKQGFGMREVESVPRTGDDKTRIDAFLLLLAFVNHGDSKSSNQRLMCLPAQMNEETHECQIPFVMVHDTGTFFGAGDQRKKPALSPWASEKVFSGPNCTVEVRSGWSGSSFPAVKISEDGRQFLLRKLEAMVNSPDHNQIRNLFAGAHMDMDPHSTIDGWVNAFVSKVREIERTGPCD
jgi:hypothetical protein